MLAGQGEAGGKAEILCGFAGPLARLLPEALKRGLGPGAVHVGQHHELVAAGSVAFAVLADGRLEAARRADDQLVARVVPHGVVDIFQPVDVHGEGDQVLGQRSQVAELLHGPHIGVAAERPGEGVLHQLIALLLHAVVGGHLIEFRIVNEHQRDAQRQRDVDGPVFPAQRLLHADAHQHQQQHGVKRRPVLPAIGLAVHQKLRAEEHDHRDVDRRVERIERAVGVVVLGVHHHHPAVEEGHDLEYHVADEHVHQGSAPAAAELHLRYDGPAHHRRGHVIQALHHRQHPSGDGGVAAELHADPLRERREGDDAVGQVEQPLVLPGDPAVFPDQYAQHAQRHPRKRAQRGIVAHQVTPPPFKRCRPYFIVNCIAGIFQGEVPERHIFFFQNLLLF